MKRLAVMVAVLAATPAFATNGLRLTAFSPLNASLGGAGVAFGMDSSALVLNPATMADLGSRVDFGAAYFPTTIKYSATSNYIGSGVPALEGLGALLVNQPNVTQTSDFPPVPIPNIGVIIPLTKEWRLGLGMAAVAGAGTDYAANLFSSTVQTTYFNFRFPIGVSWQVMDMLSVGATLNGSWALMGYSFGTSFGFPPHPVASSFGVGATLGAKLKPLPILAIGAAWESPTWFQPFKYNIGCANPGGAVPPGTFPQCGPLGVPGGREELKMDLPWNASLGVEVELLDGMLLLLGDAQYIAWSTTLGPNQPSFVNSSATLTTQYFPFNANWEDQWVYKIGAQLKATDWLKIRAGFNYGKAPQDPDRAFENIAFPAFVESHVTVGLGLQLSSAVTLNLASVIGLENTISGTSPLPDLGPLVGAPPYPAPGSLPPATLSYKSSSAGYTVEAGLSVTY
ncbi:MAG TPA: outer membrane protein transport protein [Anaeromyxobacteraceae bacterium]|nr:outer membrane protein transport protein [Anaeromyxobacteraceae bacterium]